MLRVVGMNANRMRDSIVSLVCVIKAAISNQAAQSFQMPESLEFAVQSPTRVGLQQHQRRVIRCRFSVISGAEHGAQQAVVMQLVPVGRKESIRKNSVSERGGMEF
jgi:hypothetical protein